MPGARQAGGRGRATLDFFASQQAARRRTALLVAAFLLAVLAVIAIVYLGVMFSAAHVGMASCPWDGGLFLCVALVVTSVTGLGVAYHSAALRRDGGEGVARMLGGTPIDRQTKQADERQLLNVVEEMSIASGLPVPRVFVLRDEAGVNAFAAGSSPSEAVIAVTRGAMEQLTRDELQGVVAHEFSHVLNADMTLNMRLMGAVGGLAILGLMGRTLMRVGWSRSSRRGGGLFPLVGLMLVVAGAVGVLCGKLVRFAVSRAREYLADAAAVQFTRNPDGLAGALRKIARMGSALSTAHAPEASHFLFADAAPGLLERWFSTHPPVEERIRLLQPLGEPVAATPSASSGGAPPAATSLAPEQVAARVGALRPAQLARAGEILTSLPPEIAAAAREPFGARALACGLLLARDPAARDQQLRAPLDPAVLGELRRLAPGLDALGRERAVAVLDLALPSLDALSAQQADALRAELRALAEADGRVTVYEWAIQHAVARRLDRSARRAPAGVRHRAVADVQVECLELLSLLAWVGASDAGAAQAALDAGVAALGERGSWRLLPQQRLGAAQAERALGALDEASPFVKERVLAACAACVMADARVTSDEAGLLSAVASSLGCPLPPLVPDEPRSAAA